MHSAPESIPVSEQTPQPTQQLCTGCMEEFPVSKIMTPPCKHPYCVPCLKQFFFNAVRDQELFPPRCCNLPIPLYLVYRKLSRNDVKLWRDKVAEYTSKDKIYCSNPACAAFIWFPSGTEPCAGSTRGEVATCKSCKHGTCVRCKNAEHGGDCPEDAELTATLSTAAKLGWQRCRTCMALVERSYGCQHMSCRCGAQWCYRCALKWGTCSCSDFQAEEEDIQTRTLDDLLIKREDLAEVQRRREEREEARKRAWENCNHGGRLSEKLRGRAKAREKGTAWKKGKEKEKEKADEPNSATAPRDNTWWGEEGLWKYKWGESQCDQCEIVMRDYIWRCEGCGMEACMACREEKL